MSCRHYEKRGTNDEVISSMKQTNCHVVLPRSDAPSLQGVRNEQRGNLTNRRRLPRYIRSDITFRHPERSVGICLLEVPNLQIASP